jgi:hypothetical protein
MCGRNAIGRSSRTRGVQRFADHREEFGDLERLAYRSQMLFLKQR